MKISGYGPLGNWQLKKMLRTINPEEFAKQYFDATFVEDSALILISQLRKEGYLRPTLEVHLMLSDGNRTQVTWTNAVEAPLPRSLQARNVRFRIREGVRYHYEHLRFEGLESITEGKARSYFIETGGLLRLKSARVFTPDRLKRGLSNLIELLARQGYRDADATASHLEQDDRTGAVSARIKVDQGRRFLVRSVRVETFGETNEPLSDVQMVFPDQPYSRLWLQDFTQSWKVRNYHRGYPDTTVDVKIAEPAEEVDPVQLDLLASVATGPQIRVGHLDFQGEQRTKESVMKRRVPLGPGDLLDRTKAEQGRSRLARLGVFESVRLRYDEIDGQTRDVTYEVTEGKTFNVNLLLGYGSYELLRGGFELEQRNIFGRTHHARLRAIQSLKSSRGDFTYTMPELIGEEMDVFLHGFGLRREEVSFVREEFGGGAGVHRYLAPIATDASFRYTYQVLNAAKLRTDVAIEGVTNPAVGAVILDLRHDRRDNPLYPRRGYKLFGTYEFASEFLAGDVNYQRVELAGAVHFPLGTDRALSVGLSHGLVSTKGRVQADLPFNKRFFPGGEYSIRGYQEGEAAPRNEDNKIVGAETFLLGTVEFEQALTPKFWLVFFFDAIGFARHLTEYPVEESLFSVGGGLRWKTIVGPVRLEYGHNLNPRTGDPEGTLHFSLGFPF